MNPLWQQKELKGFCEANNIILTAYAPLGANGNSWGDNRIFECNVLEDIAKSRGKTTAQVSLRWLYEQGVTMIPKSYNTRRMKENLDIFDWSLTKEELMKISQLPQRKGFYISSMTEASDVVREIDAEL
ncbi:D-galacturonate reductase-like protein [Tanacetum coccineum]